MSSFVFSFSLSVKNIITMMTKEQKIWLGIFLAMFVVPEVLWGDVVGFFKLSFLPIYDGTSIWFSDHTGTSMLIILIEIVGCCGCVFILKNTRASRTYKYILYVLFSAILVLLLMSLYFTYLLS